MVDFDGKRFFIYGDGISGRAAQHAIKKRGGRAKIYSDACGRFVAPPEKNYAAAVVSPGIKPTHAVYGYCKERGIRTVSEVEIGFAIADCDIVAVTGTNGKTTTVRLLADMLGGTACGNIGFPITAAADCAKRKTPLVAELSSFQLHDAVVSPRVAVITNAAADHVDWHGSIEAYYAAKCNIANNMHGGYLVLGADVPIIALESLHTDAEIVRCAVDSVVDGAYLADGYFCFMGSRVCPEDYLRLQGEHNIKNALCAIAAAKCMGADNGQILAALCSATSAPHRIEYVGEAAGKRWIDDSKGTNIAACLVAVETVSGTVCLIAGGRNKGLDFAELFEALPERVVEVVAMGESAQALRDCATGVTNAKITVVDGLSRAVAAAAQSEAKTVLLSPACASFDEFKDYAARGDRFAAEVRALGSK